MSDKFDWQADINEALNDYSLLNLSRFLENGRNRLVGEIELINPDTNSYIDIYEVEIDYTEIFPYQFPKVIETGGKIPRDVSRHVMPESNHLCFAVEIEEILLCKQGISTLWFLDKVLVPRLCEEYNVSRGAKYQREYSHDFGGTWEFLMNKLKTTDQKIILSFIGGIIYKQLPKRNKPCICNSGVPYGLCHRLEVAYLQHLGNENLKELYFLLREHPYVCSSK